MRIVQTQRRTSYKSYNPLFLFRQGVETSSLLHNQIIILFSPGATIRYRPPSIREKTVFAVSSGIRSQIVCTFIGKWTEGCMTCLDFECLTLVQTTIPLTRVRPISATGYALNKFLFTTCIVLAKISSRDKATKLNKTKCLWSFINETEKMPIKY